MIDDYRTKLNKCKYKKDVDTIKLEAQNDGLIIKDNSSFIAQAERQCVNARIQGGAASMSKRAMIAVYKDDILRNLGFRLLIAVHDELIGECPIENKEQVKTRMSELMIKSALPEVTVPMKCDADDFPSWYYDVYSSDIKKEYNKLLENSNKSVAFRRLLDNHIECTEEQIVGMLS